jgi:RecA/RadA recombinase
MVKNTMVKEDTKEAAPKGKLIGGIDISKLVAKAQSNYSKADAGRAKALATGTSIPRPDSDGDFVIWTAGNHWQTLTTMRGLPFGRIVQISGKADSGKSTHAAAFMKFAQDQDVLVILWDAEKKFNAHRFDTQIGGSSDNLLIVDTNNILEGAKGVAHFINAAKEMNPKVKILIVWDSVGSSVNSSEDNAENEDYSKQPGISAKEVGFAIRKFNKLSNQYQDRETGKDTIATLIINQTYSSIGMGAPTQIEKGGVELGYLSSIIIQLSRKQDLIHVKKGDKYKFGIVTRAKVKKNHLFEGKENISELDLVISADGVRLKTDVKGKDDSVSGWDDPEDTED